MLTTATALKRLATVAKEAGLTAYVVGGYVRDFLLGHPEQPDIDIVVEGSGLSFAKLVGQDFRQAGSLVEFPDFDTARYILGDGDRQLILEFAGARRETYNPASRKPRVAAATITDDLGRRDFTVNAMAVPLALFVSARRVAVATLKKQLLDPFHGQAALKDKILKTPLDPELTFNDDPLRMLRAVRFAAQLGFAIAPEALQAIFKQHTRLKIISAERLQEELFKLLAAPRPSVGLALMFQTRLLDMVLPEVAALDGVEEIFGHQHKNNLVHTFKVVDNIATESGSMWLRLAGLLHDIGKPATKKFVPKIGWTFHGHEHVGKKMVQSLGRRLRFSNDLIQYLGKLIRWHLQPIALMDEGITDSAVRRLVVTMGGLLDDLLILGRSDITTGNPYKRERRLKNYDRLKAKIAEVLAKDKLRAFQSPVRGDEIMAATKLKPGPTVGKIKDAIEQAILDGIIPNDYAAAQKYFAQIKDDFVLGAAAWERI